MFTTIASCLVLLLTALKLLVGRRQDMEMSPSFACLGCFQRFVLIFAFYNLVWNMKFQYKVTNFTYIIFPV